MQRYIKQISELTNPSFQSIRQLANNCITHLPKSERDELYYELKRGVALLNTHEQMCQYLWSFGNMHEAKIKHSLDKLNFSEFNGECDIVDWGCGQGLATLTFMDYLNQKNHQLSINSITLIEPSDKALERAKLHVSSYQTSYKKLITLQKYLDEVDVKDIQTDGNRPVIHFFSNILDIEHIDLKALATKLDKSVNNSNYIISVGPVNPNNRRIDAFYDYFQVPIIFGISDPFFNYGGYSSCSFKAKVYKLEYTAEGNLIPIEFYPSVQFHSAYELDIVGQNRKSNVKIGPEIINQLNSFEVSAPFDFGASVYDDVNPILAVLNNIIIRGLPTKASPYIEEVFQKAFGFSSQNFIRGEIVFNGELKFDYSDLLKQCNNSVLNGSNFDFTRYDRNLVQLVFTPVAVARVQKILLEALMTHKLNIADKTWDILVEEQDVPCAALAIEDLKQMFFHLTQLSVEYQDLRLPEINLEIISSCDFCSSPLHLDYKPTVRASAFQYEKVYDLVIDIGVFQKSNINKTTFSKFKCKHNCYFNIRSATEKRNERLIYTSERIKYQELVTRDLQGRYSEISDTCNLLRYFVRLVFRKDDFRPGQLPILNRALQNKSVIGLLPTGGGKSLTYQLAAMLQPGVTLVVDPLSSLMKDQYDGLMNAGIDCCTFINATLLPEEKSIRESRMEASQLLFVFLSPERLGIYQFRERLKNMEELHIYFAYGVIDEVHCVSEWGHDFRFTYLHLGRNLYKYVKAKDGEISMFGLTATASFDVLADVERELSGEGAFNLDADTIVRFENTNRLELQYKIEKISVEFEVDERFYRDNNINNDLPKAVQIANSKAFHNAKVEFLNKYVNTIPNYFNELQSNGYLTKIKDCFLNRQDMDNMEETDLAIEMPFDYYSKKQEYDQAAIIFCPHKANTGIAVETVSKNLEKSVKDLGTFLGGDESDNSMNNLELFRDNKQPVMVATKAFGMGIDKPNVRFTVNMNFSSSLEGFVQEAGRAGRDRKLALSTILFSDYKLARVKKEFIQNDFPLDIKRGKWFKPEDLITISKRLNLNLRESQFDYLTPELDLVRITCLVDKEYDQSEKRKYKYFGFYNCNEVECKEHSKCELRKVPDKATGWQYLNDLNEILISLNLIIDKKYLQYQNTDYETMMHFFNKNFKGAGIEKRFMHNLLSVNSVVVFFDDMVEVSDNLLKVEGFLTSLLNSPEDSTVVTLVPYIPSDKKKKIEGNDVDIAKAIYRMSCIGLIEDFTQDYRNNRYRIVAKRKGESQYYEGLRIFLRRYFSEDRASQEVEKAMNYKLPYVSENSIKNEIYRCLAYLTEFVYDKISTKRKRAIDQIRNFCLIGLQENKDWKELNEDLKDELFYYFNSKYARSGYQTENGQPYSLTDDTDNGKESTSKILFKFLKINDPDVIGFSTPIDNVKHLQGAVRLIRRSLTDKNPCLSLLNAYCLYFLGTRNNVNLENELLTSYKEGMEEFANRMEENPSAFWKLFDDYNAFVSQFANKKQFTKLKNEVMLTIHSNELNNLTERYLQ